MVFFARYILSPLLVLLISPLGFALENTRVFITPFEIENKAFNLVIVHSTEQRAYQSELAEPLLNIAQEWALEQYVIQERIERGSQLYHDLATKEKFTDGRSSLVMITAADDVRNIEAMLRVSREAPEIEGLERLPLEIRLNTEIERMPWEVRLITPMDETGILEPSPRFPHPVPITRSNLAEVSLWDDPTVLYGDTLELKNWIKRKSSSYDFIPALFYFAEYYKLTLVGRRVHELWPKYFMHLRTSLGFVGKYGLECDKAMVDYYKLLGFGLDEVIGDTYRMSILRDDFVNIWKLLEGRPGLEIVNQMRGQIKGDDSISETIRNQLLGNGCNRRLGSL